MNSCSCTLARFSRAHWLWLILCAAFVVVSSIAFGQDVTLASAETSSIDPTPPPAESSEPPPPTEGPSDELDGRLPVPQSESRLAVVGTDGGDVSAVAHKFHYAAHVSVRAVYDDNINLTNTDRSSDYYFTIEPVITLGYGDMVERQETYLRLDYAPSAFLFADHSDFDAVQHVIRLEGQHRFSRLTLSLSQDVQILDGANLNTNALSTNGAVLDVAGRQRLNVYVTHLDANYDLTGKTFLSGGIDYRVTDYRTDLNSSAVLSGNLFVNYRYSPKLTVGLGGTGGYDWVDAPSPEQTFEQVNVRASYQITGKISLNASGGVEFRQFEGDSRGEYITPVYEVGATYQPFDGTTISLTGSRRTLNSAVFNNQDYAASNIIFGIRQRFLQRVFVGLTAGYENTDYFATVDGVNATRSDNYFFIEPAVDITITPHLSTGVYYLHRRNDSSTDFFSFYDNQVGVQLAFTF